MKICIIGLDDYPHLADKGSPNYVGGESVQHVLLAHAWRDLGVDVTMVVHDYGQGPSTVIDGVRAVAAYARGDGVPVLRAFHPRITGLLRAMREADADVYYQSPAGVATGCTVWFCKRHGKRSIVRIASDLACIPGDNSIRFWRDRKIYEYGLRNADLVVAQSEQQQRLLRRHYKLDSQLLNMAVEIPREPLHVANGDGAVDVLWVANLRPVKRPELVLELARRLPHVRFVMAGGSLPGGEEYYRDIVRASEGVPNVRCLGPVPYAAVGELFSRAKVFLNTSSIEGFPNTFLQAWVRGVPVATFFDPDGIVKRRELGRAVESVEDMAHALEALLADEDARRAMGARGRAYASEEFSATRIARRYLEMLEQQDEPRALRYGTSG